MSRYLGTISTAKSILCWAGELEVVGVRKAHGKMTFERDEIRATLSSWGIRFRHTFERPAFVSEDDLRLERSKSRNLYRVLPPERDPIARLRSKLDGVADQSQEVKS